MPDQSTEQKVTYEVPVLLTDAERDQAYMDMPPVNAALLAAFVMHSYPAVFDQGIAFIGRLNTAEATAAFIEAAAAADEDGAAPDCVHDCDEDNCANEDCAMCPCCGVPEAAVADGEAGA